MGPAIRYAAFMIQFGEGDCRCGEESIVCLGFGMLESVFESSEKMVFSELFHGCHCLDLFVIVRIVCRAWEMKGRKFHPVLSGADGMDDFRARTSVFC